VSRRTNLLVFDDYVPLGTTSKSPVYTSVELQQELALFDQIAVQAVIDDVTRAGGFGATAGFSLNIQTSGDGRNFANLNAGNTPEVSIPGSPGLSTTAPNVAAGSFPGAVSNSTTLLAFVRFAIQFTERTTAAHVKVYVTQRDQAK
jgi:hypothetical protein